MLRGEYWLAKWPNDPLRKPRPVVVLSNDSRNGMPHIPDVVVAKVTSLARRDGSVKTVNPAEDLKTHLKKDSIVRCGALYTVEKTWLERKLGVLTSLEMRRVDQLLKNVFDLT